MRRLLSLSSLFALVGVLHQPLVDEPPRKEMERYLRRPAVVASTRAGAATPVAAPTASTERPAKTR